MAELEGSVTHQKPLFFIDKQNFARTGFWLILNLYVYSPIRFFKIISKAFSVEDDISGPAGRSTAQWLRAPCEGHSGLSE